MTSNWFVLCRGGGHAVMDFYAACTKQPVLIEWDIQVSESQYANALTRTSVATLRNQELPGQRATFYNYEDTLDSPLTDWELPTVFVVRSLLCNVASRLKLRSLPGYETNTPVDEEWLTMWLNFAQRVLNGEGIFYDLWFVDEGYRRQVGVDLSKQGFDIEYTEKTLNQICNPRRLASSFDRADKHDRAQEMNVLFRDEEFEIPQLPYEYLEMNTQLLHHFDFNRKDWSKRYDE